MFLDSHAMNLEIASQYRNKNQFSSPTYALQSWVFIIFSYQQGGCLFKLGCIFEIGNWINTELEWVNFKGTWQDAGDTDRLQQTYFKVIGNVFKHCLKCYMIFLLNWNKN